MGILTIFCLDLLIDPPDEDEKVTLVHPSPYYGANRLPAGLSHPHQLNILSWNVQSLYAKFDQFAAFLEIARQQNIRFHVICIQESWPGRTSNIFDLLGHDPYQDPNTNYNKLHDKLMKLKDKNLPIRFQKFDKHKHKGNKGITKGILKSIKYKDQLYKALKGTAQSDPSYTVRKDNLSAYKKNTKKIYKRSKNTVL